MILSRYIARRFMLAFALVFSVMLGVLLLIDMVEQLRQFSGRPLGFGDAARLALLQLPGSLYTVLPLIVMLATLALFLGLSRSSELVVARASGRSALHVVAAPLIMALLIGVIAVSVLNPIVAVTSKQYDQRSARIAGGGDDSVLSVSREGLWMREGGPAGQRVIAARQAAAQGTHLFEVSILGFVPGVGPVTRIEAEEAVLNQGAWTLSAAKVWQLDDPNPEHTATTHAQLDLATDLDAARIRDSFAAPGAIGVWNLPGFISALESAGLSAREHRVWFQMELALPLFLMAMVLIGAGFTMRHFRAGRRGVLVLAALLSGFAAFFLRNLAQVLGENGQIPVALAAWSPPAVAVLMALALLLHLEEG